MASRTPGVVLALFELVIVVLTAVAIGSAAWTTSSMADPNLGVSTASEVGLLRSKTSATPMGSSTSAEAPTDDLCASLASGTDARSKCDRAVASGKAAFAMQLIAIVVNGFAGLAACVLAGGSASARGLWICITSSVCASALLMIIGTVVFGAGMHAPLKELYGAAPAALGWSFGSGVDVAAVAVNFLATFACWALWMAATQRHVARSTSGLGMAAPVPVPALTNIKVDFTKSFQEGALRPPASPQTAPTTNCKPGELTF
eukprot:tig00020904_g15253.t1